MKLSRPIQLKFLFFLGLLFIFVACTKEDDETQSNRSQDADRQKTDIQLVKEYISFTRISTLALRDLPKRAAWQKAAPKVVEIAIPRKNGEPDQPALWYHSGTPERKPLMLVLHSWSDDYLQHYGIPHGVFAEKNDWIFIHPNYRGPFDNEDATASEKAVRDVLDALEYAKSHAPVDENRIYLEGFSGGAMMSLIMAGRYPEKFTAAAAWVPVYDLHDWYVSLIPKQYYYTDHYRADIEASCGGKPDTDDDARAACRKRSPSAYLADARGKGVKVFVSAGIQDPFVPPSHAIRSFNDLAGEEDRIPEADYRFIDETETLPESLKGQGESNRFFAEAGLPVVFTRTSKDVTLILFDGGHDIVYNAGFQWLSKQHH